VVRFHDLVWSTRVQGRSGAVPRPCSGRPASRDVVVRWCGSRTLYGRPASRDVVQRFDDLVWSTRLQGRSAVRFHDFVWSTRLQGRSPAVYETLEWSTCVQGRSCAVRRPCNGRPASREVVQSDSTAFKGNICRANATSI